MIDACPSPPAVCRDNRWWQLFYRGSPVGFRRWVGRAEMFSRDGYAWTGERLLFDAQHPETGLRDLASRRIFHGDVVTMRVSPRTQELIECVVLLGPSEAVLLGRPGSTRLLPVEKHWPPPRRASVRLRVGSVFVERHFRLAYDASLGALQTMGWSPWLFAALAAWAQLLGMGAAGVLQWQVTGRVGPLATLLGGVVALVGVMLAYRARSSHALSRHRLWKAAPRAALLVALHLALAYYLAASSGAAGLARTPAGVAVGAVTAFVLGYLVAFALTATVGNAVDHYGRRSPRPRYRDLP